MQKIFLLAFVLVALGLSGCVKSQDYEKLCQENNGTWLDEYQECESLPKSVCEENGGTFKECESACRHETGAVMCTMQCVLVCEFPPKENEDDSAKNASYLIDGENIALKNGHAETEIMPNSASKNVTDVLKTYLVEDVTGDHKKDQVVILTQNNGGSGTFFYAAVFDGEKGSNARLLNDRIRPVSAEEKDGEIVVNYLDRRPWESFVTKPTLSKSKYLKFADGILSPVKKFPKLEADQARKLAEKKWGTCENQCEDMKIKILDGRDHAWFVEAIYEGLMDDSIQAQKYVSQAHYTDGNWMLGEALVKEHRCRKGRGHTDFGVELCN